MLPDLPPWSFAASGCVDLTPPMSLRHCPQNKGDVGAIMCHHTLKLKGLIADDDDDDDDEEDDEEDSNGQVQNTEVQVVALMVPASMKIVKMQWEPLISTFPTWFVA